MKTQLTFCAVALLAMLTLGCASINRHVIDSAVLRPGDIEGSWVGYDEDSPSFCRLSLEPRGEGSCVVLFFDGTSSIYSVKRWELDANGLNLQLTPRADAESVNWKIRSVGEYEMRLEARGYERGWKHEIVLYKSEDLEPRIHMTEEIARRDKKFFKK